jgi:hypothetical protein
MTQTEKSETHIGWQPYRLDHYAQELVIQNRDKKNVLNESHKMRMAVAYGLERFWGEHLRYERENNSESKDKGAYWKAVWITLARILKDSGIEDLPDSEGTVQFDNRKGIEDTANAIWQFSSVPEQRRVALMVLTQLCDSLVWWTQRYKKKKEE